MKRTAALAILGLLLCSILEASAETKARSYLQLPKDCSQLVLVTSPSWSSSTGTLQRMEKNREGVWQNVALASDVRLGRKGMVWESGIGPSAIFPGARKREGDDKAPAGIFPLVLAFGYSREAPGTRLHYIPITETLVCVDDPHSHHYNQLTDARVNRADWKSAEQMKLRDDRYKWGVFVAHNQPPHPGAGSCIFLHVWKDRNTATSGCTAMPEPVMLAVIKWLDPARNPVLVQMPRDVYRETSRGSNLPQI